MQLLSGTGTCGMVNGCNYKDRSVLKATKLCKVWIAKQGVSHSSHSHMLLAEPPHCIPEAEPGQVIVLRLCPIHVLQGGIEPGLVVAAAVTAVGAATATEVTKASQHRNLQLAKSQLSWSSLRSPSAQTGN